MAEAEEEVATYSELVKLLREKITAYIRDGISGAVNIRNIIQLRNKPVDIDGRMWDGRVAAADGGSAILPFADREVGFVSAITLADNGRGYSRRFRGDLILQKDDEDDGQFSDRVDVERESMMLSLAAEAVNETSLLIVDGPLIPRPKYVGEYMYWLRELSSRAEKAGTALVGFVKRPQSYLLDETLPLGNVMDRAALYMVLDINQAYPWPPRQKGNMLYTYIRLAEPPHAGIFRVDAPTWLGEDRMMDVLRYVVASTDPVKSIPAILAKADEEVKMSKKLVKDLYMEVFEREAGGVDPKLWAFITLRWGEW
jgi:hypothetical protein